MSERIDPVCGMAIAEQAQITYPFHGEKYAFCSNQCREAFIAHPHVYVGRLGQKAPKKLGVEVRKERTLKLDEQPTPEQTRAIEQALAAVMGLKDLTVRGQRVHVIYDLVQVTAMQIEAAINAAGVQLSQSVNARLRRAWVGFGEENELSNLGVRNHDCRH